MTKHTFAKLKILVCCLLYHYFEAFSKAFLHGWKYPLVQRHLSFHVLCWVFYNISLNFKHTGNFTSLSHVTFHLPGI